MIFWICESVFVFFSLALFGEIPPMWHNGHKNKCQKWLANTIRVWSDPISVKEIDLLWLYCTETHQHYLHMITKEKGWWCFLIMTNFYVNQKAIAYNSCKYCISFQSRTTCTSINRFLCFAWKIILCFKDDQGQTSTWIHKTYLIRAFTFTYSCTVETIHLPGKTIYTYHKGSKQYCAILPKRTSNKKNIKNMDI